MKVTLRKTVFIIAIALSCTTYSGIVSAQSVEQCMSADTADALKICHSLLESGSRNADVFYKLSSAQYQDGQRELSKQTLHVALKLYPGNKKLISLKEIIASNTSEQARIERSTKLNQNSLDKGALKITCLIKSGEEAISACKRRLELTDDDGDRIRFRLAELNDSQVPPRPDVPELNPAPTPRETVADPVEQAKQETPALGNPPAPDVPNGSDILDERQKAHRELVSDIQTRLNEFGFDAGFADGEAGRRSRKALADFYAAVGAPVSTSFTVLTLDDLRDEKLKLASAEKLLQQSEQALQQGNIQFATQSLADAKQTSKLLKVPDRLELGLIQGAAPTQPEAPNVDPKPTHSPLPTTTDTPPESPPQQTASRSKEFSDLMEEITFLHGKIQRQQDNQRRRLERIRGAF